MLEQEMAEVARSIMEDCTNVRPDEEVVVITDAEKIAVGRAINAAARSLGATSNIVIKPRLDAHGDELPDSVAAAMKQADVTVDANTHAISHTEARREASETGTRHIVLREVTPEMMIDGTISTDFTEIKKLTKTVATIQSDASSGEITCPNGTDIWFDLDGRKSLHDDWAMNAKKEGSILALPEGKCGITPIEGNSEGEVVIDYSMDNIGKLQDPIKLSIKEGLVQTIQGGREAEKLKTIVERAGEGARNVAEAGSLGTNPHLDLVGVQAIDKKVLGTANFAIGDNRSLGGTVRSDIHLDGVVSKPTVEFDGERIIDDGKFQYDTAYRLAGIEP